MNNHERKYRIAQEVLIILGVITLLSFICRLWPIIILALVGVIVAAIRLLFLKFSGSRKEEPKEPPADVRPSEPTERDLYDMAYGLIQTQISALVEADYVGAKWVWDISNAKRRIKDGEDVFISLNGAGGYRRAKVRMVALRAVALEYPSEAEDEQVRPDPEKTPDDTEDDAAESTPELKVDYGLIAFEWVEAHIMELNARMNETIGEGKSELLLPPAELPVAESWEKICEELNQAGISQVVQTDQGIKINLTH